MTADFDWPAAAMASPRDLRPRVNPFRRAAGVGTVGRRRGAVGLLLRQRHRWTASHQLGRGVPESGLGRLAALAAPPHGRHQAIYAGQACVAEDAEHKMSGAHGGGRFCWQDRPPTQGGVDGGRW